MIADSDRMLSTLVREQEARTEGLRAGQEGRKKEALEAATSLTQAIVDHLNIGSVDYDL